MMEKLTQDMADTAWAIIEEVESMGGMTKAVESGWAKLKIEECAAEKQARIDSGKDVIVGVNKYRLDKEDAGRHPRDRQLGRARLADRAAQAGPRRPRRRRPCEHALARADRVRPHAARATCSTSPSRPSGRGPRSARCPTRSRRSGAATAPTNQVISGVYGAAFGMDQDWEDLKAEVAAFAEAEGRRPRVMIAKLGQDGHDRGAKVVATAFADLGFDVDIGPLFQTPEEAARQAIENDCHAVGVSTLAAGHKTLVPALVEALKDQGAEDIIVFVGGVIPAQDYEFLYEAGVGGIYGPGTPIPASAKDVLEEIKALVHA